MTLNRCGFLRFRTRFGNSELLSLNLLFLRYSSWFWLWSTLYHWLWLIIRILSLTHREIRLWNTQNHFSYLCSRLRHSWKLFRRDLCLIRIATWEMHGIDLISSWWWRACFPYFRQWTMCQQSEHSDCSDHSGVSRISQQCARSLRHWSHHSVNWERFWSLLWSSSTFSQFWVCPSGQGTFTTAEGRLQRQSTGTGSPLNSTTAFAVHVPVLLATEGL